MKGDRTGAGPWGANIALGVVALALLLRLLIPAGWMPAASSSGFTITLCTGMGAATAWIDAEGNVHKEEPAKTRTDHPCVFAGFSAAFDLSKFDDGLVLPFGLIGAFALPMASTVAVGRGLAAPPPPPTGPPASL